MTFEVYTTPVHGIYSFRVREGFQGILPKGASPFRMNIRRSLWSRFEFHVMMTNVAAVRNTNSKAYETHDAPLGIIIILNTACWCVNSLADIVSA